MSHVHEQHGHGHHDHEGLQFASVDRLARLSSPVHHLGRRRFLTELGRNTFAVAILGGLAAACSKPSDEAVDVAPLDPQADDGVVADGGQTLTWSQVSLGNVSAYVLVRGNEAAVVDTGNPGSVDQIGETLAALGATYDDVRHVVLTHRHPDHVGSLSDVLTRASSSVAYAGEADIGDISTATDIVAVGDGDDVFGLQVIETPGHTPGSISLLDVGIGLLIAGDALNGNSDGTEITGPNDRFSSDMATAEASAVKLAGFEFEAAAFGHGNPVITGAGGLVAELAAQL
jgi:glyoxylase-like metal-dependent hydrolase (beta-lactamase superfamily II)